MQTLEEPRIENPPNTQLLQQQYQLQQLVLAAQAGDRDAMGKLIERYQDSVYAVAYRRLNNHAEAQELTQEVFVQALQKIDQLREPACFGGWLRSITTRLAINRSIRKAPITSGEPELFDPGTQESDSPLGQMLALERQQQVQAGLKRLRTLDRKTLIAFYVKGHTLLEMSDEFESPVGTIKRRLHVARKRLAKELEGLIAA